MPIKEVFLRHLIGVFRKICFHMGCLGKEGVTIVFCQGLPGQFGSSDIGPRSIRGLGYVFPLSNLEDLAQRRHFQGDQSKVD